ncbi:MAG: ribonuclease H-like domain-containing protein [Candidatus Limnocylindrales bacterium]
MDQQAIRRADRLARLRTLDRRLTVASDLPLPTLRAPAGGGAAAGARAAALAHALGGSVAAHAGGSIVVVERTVRLPLDLASLVGLPLGLEATRPLVLLDTETTGLGTAAGTLAFLVGLGWWTDETLVVRQLWLPDHAAEPALLSALEALLPPTTCLVTYNGRSFDWPLLVTRFRLHRRAPPVLAGHLDLLPLARQLWRHRLTDARLSTVEAGVAGVARHDDLPGALVPERYFAYLHGAGPGPLRAIGAHNREDVVSMGRLLQVLAQELAGPDGRRAAHPGDVAALARLLRRHGRRNEAAACYDDALEACQRPDAPRSVDEAAIALERARLLARVGRRPEARMAWQAIAQGSGRAAIVALVALAKDHEHHRRDLVSALAAAQAAERLLARRRAVGALMPDMEQDLPRRLRRLRRRLAGVQPPMMAVSAASVRSTSASVL